LHSATYKDAISGAAFAVSRCFRAGFLSFGCRTVPVQASEALGLHDGRAAQLSIIHHRSSSADIDYTMRFCFSNFVKAYSSQK